MQANGIDKDVLMAVNPLAARYRRRSRYLEDVGLKEWTEMTWRSFLELVAECGVRGEPAGKLTLVEACFSYCAGKDVDDILRDFAELYSLWGGLDALLKLDGAEEDLDAAA